MADVYGSYIDNPRLMMRALPIVRLSKFFVLLVCLSLLTIDAFQTWNAYEVRLKESNVLAVNLVSSIAQHAEDAFKEADTILLGLVERVEVEGTSPAKLKRLRNLMLMRVVELPKLHGLFLYDKNGRWLENSQPKVIKSANNGDRDYFIYHRDHPGRQPFIGKPVQSRSTGEWIVTISRRINQPDGSFAGVALATLPLNYFREFYETFNIGKNGTVFLAHADGILYLRRPFMEDKTGADISDWPLFRDQLPHKSFGSYTNNRSAIDGLERLLSYRRVQQYPLVVAVSLSKEDIFSSWLADAAKHFVITGVLALVLGFLGIILTRQIVQRLSIEDDLREAQNELKELNLELKEMAMQDGLTGLANRRRFDIALNEEFHRALRNNLWLSLIMIDVDLFKQYNDIFGHPEGDECLKKISAAVNSCLNRAEDMAARYGGEEIAVLLSGTDLPGAVAVAERIRLAIRDLKIAHPGSSTGVITVSCGVDAILPVRNENIPQDLVQSADKVLYKAKSSGRDHVMSSLSKQFDERSIFARTAQVHPIVK